MTDAHTRHDQDPFHPGAPGRRCGAFTLVELLVSIAIIALLIAIIVPALAGARNSARLVKSLSNNRQICGALSTYKAENRDYMPIIVSASGKYTSWSFGGKNCNASWAGVFGGEVDIPAWRRPLNPHLYPDFNTTPVTVAYQAQRDLVQLEVFRSPGDKGSYQDGFYYPRLKSITSYDDVGTSYHNNSRWWYPAFNQIILHGPPSPPGETNAQRYQRILREGMRRMNIAADVEPARFVFIHDQTGDIVVNDPHARNWDGEFGGRNKSVMSFLDGHTAYMEVLPAVENGPGYMFNFVLPPNR